MTKIVDIGNTQTKVIITHARKSLLYFIRNFVDANLLQHQEETLRELFERKENDKA